MHRDLKTENMLFCKQKRYAKLIDFGFAKFSQQAEDKLTETKGTPYYMSPELIRGKYDARTDLWSVGVLAYFLISGKQPFRGDSKKDLDEKILTCDYSFDDEPWDQTSKQAIKFISDLLEPNVDRRMTCEEALNHPWIV